MATRRIPRSALLPLLAAGLLPACGGKSGTGPEPVDLPNIAVGLARLDLSPNQRLTGYLAFFYDPDRKRLMTAQVRVNELPLGQTLEPGIVPGPIYFQGVNVFANEIYRLAATIQASEGDIQVSSAAIAAPALFGIHAPAEAALGQPLTITWDPVANAQAFNVAVTNTAFEADVAGSATGFTVPAAAFTGLSPGQVVEIEVTAYNGFYVPLSSGISTLNDAEEAVRRFSHAENITGAGTRGSFGAATTIGALVTVR